MDTGRQRPVTRRSFFGWMAAVAGFLGCPWPLRGACAEPSSQSGLQHGVEAASAGGVAGARKTIVLDGTWQLAKGNPTDIPAGFDRRVPVPGLLSLAVPPLDLANFDRPAQEAAGAESKKESREEAFWYRRTFTVAGPIPAVARLKIAKAMYGTRVFLNGKRLGDHDPSFTPGYFDAKNALKTGENELIVRIGANRGAVGRLRAIGLDWEKKRDIPGIFDSVELILSGTPSIVNVQVGPDIYKQQALVRVQLAGARASEVALVIREAKSGKIAGRATAHASAAEEQTLDVTIPLPNCRLWSPEDPFLYRLTVQTERSVRCLERTRDPARKTRRSCACGNQTGSEHRTAGYGKDCFRHGLAGRGRTGRSGSGAAWRGWKPRPQHPRSDRNRCSGGALSVHPALQRLVA